MTPEQAATLLDAELRPYPWYIAVGVGDTDDGSTLFVYVKTAKHRKLRELARGWNGYKVVVEKTGSMRPVALHSRSRQRAAWPFVNGRRSVGS